MDLHKTIKELVDERNRLDAMIARLERSQAAEAKRKASPPKRRGRKSMPEEERAQVAERMRRYWADRRAAKQQAQPETGLTARAAS